MRHPALAMLLLLLLPASARGDAAKTTEAVGAAPLSSEELAAVGLAVQYLHEGPAAWRRALSSDSPWHALPPADAIGEIAARVGPAAGARWQLQRPGPSGDAHAAVFSVEYPSGMTETLWLELVDERGTMRLRAVKTLSEPWPLPPKETPVDRISTLPTPSSPIAPGAAAILVLLGSATLAAASGPRRLALPRVAWATLALAGIALACDRQGDRTRAAEAASEGPVALRGLVALRHALASGTSGSELQALLAAAPREGVVGDVARLWRVERMLRDYRLKEADPLLTSFPDPAPYPLVALLRARLAILRGKPEDARPHYELVRSLGADDDGLRLEAAIAIAMTDDDERTDRAFGRLTTIGSRLALPYYVAAETALAEDRKEEAERDFVIGWKLQPLSREELFRSPLLASVCTRKAVFPLLDFASVDEPHVGGPVPGAEPLAPPAGATASLVGEMLRLRFDGAEVRVPGGLALAPAETTVEAPDAFVRGERDEQVAQLATLEQQAAADGAFAQPVLRRRLELAAEGLAEQERWSDLLTLTDKLPGFAGRLPPDLTRLRAAALVRSERNREAFDLLVRLAQDDKLHGRRDTGTLYQLADALVKQQRYDLAIKVLHRANELSGLGAGEARERQVRMEKQLAEAHETYETRYFRIRYPKMTGKQYPQQLAVVLEEERKRLSAWIPVADLQPVDVDLYPVAEFLSSYASELPVVGIFDGRVRVPFADLRSLHPELVSILSHELAHALISQATAERAPKWVQEGLAQHVEMVQEVTNPFPDLDAAGGSLSLDVVEKALGGFSEEQFVELSYAEAAWAFHYLEARHGVAGIRRLLAAYKQGADNAAAVQQALGLGPAELDASLRQWAVHGAPRSWPSKVRRYDNEATKLALMAENEAPPTRVAGVNPRFEDPHATMGRSMAAWHVGYVKWSQPLKVAYTPVQRAIVGDSWTGADAAACGRLADAAAGVIDREELFVAPDPRVGRPLHEAMVELHRLGLACSHGDVSTSRNVAFHANSLLTQLAKVFAEYGLQL